jgi:tetratricopeptide (TPR) repeat protein
MAEHPWFGRIVDLRAGDSHGTGHLIGPRLVLTARHVVVDREGRLLGQPRVRLLDGSATEDDGLTAEVLWVSRRLDAGLVHVSDDRWQPPALLAEPVRWGRVVGTEPVACRAMGFPWAQRRGADRHTEPLTGDLHPGRAVRDGRIQVTVRSGVPQRPGASATASGWAGISGAALLCGPLITGVVTEETLRFDGVRITAEPVERLLADAEFRAKVKKETGHEPAVEPVELASLLAPPEPVPAESRASLLRADLAVVGFEGREEDLNDFRRWCLNTGENGGEDAPVRLLIGPGGQGKTRLASKLACELLDEGWVSGWFRRDHLTEPDYRLLSGNRLPLLLIVDYAENRPDHVRKLIMAAAAHQGAPLRVLLIARSTGEWWPDLVDHRLEGEARRLARHARVHPLGVLVERVEDRPAAFGRAVRELSARVPESWAAGDPDRVSPPADLGTGPYESPLAIQTAALVALLQGGGDPVETSPGDGPEDVLLEHEARYWTRTAEARGIALSHPVLRQAAVAATVYAAADEHAATDLLAALPWLADQPSATRLDLAQLLRDLYPPPADRHGYWGTLQPDRLAEHLAVHDLAANERLADALSSRAARTEETAHYALTLFARAHRHAPEAARAVLARALDRELERLALPAATVAGQTGGGLAALLTDAIQVRPLPVDTLRRLIASIPTQHHALAELGLSVSDMGQLADYGGEDAVRAQWKGFRGYWLCAALRPGEGLPLIEECLAELERLSATDDRLRPTLGAWSYFAALLASSLTRHDARGFVWPDMPNPSRVVALAERSVGIFGEPPADARRLAVSLLGLSQARESAGHRDGALDALDEALRVSREAADRKQEAAVLVGRSEFLARTGRPAEALRDVGRGLGVLAGLPGSEESRAKALSHRTKLLLASGEVVEAGRCLDEEIDLRRWLAGTNPDVYGHGLMEALGRKAEILAAAGEEDGCLAVLDETVALGRRLTDVRSLVTLAQALDMRHERTADAVPPEEAIAVSREIAATYRRAAALSPLPAHPLLCVHLTGFLMEYARWPDYREEAVEAGREAVAIARRYPSADGPSLSHALLMLAEVLDRSEEREESIQLLRDYVQRWRAGEEPEDPDERSSVAEAHALLSRRLAATGAREDALRHVDVAIGLLAHATPTDQAAEALNLRGQLLLDTGLPAEAATAASESETILRGVPSTDDVRWPLADALRLRGAGLVGSGRNREAIPPLTEATGILRELHASHADAPGRLLAVSLDQLVRLLDAEGRDEDALRNAAGAVDVYRSLAADDPGRYEPTLAWRLRDLATRLERSPYRDDHPAFEEVDAGIREVRRIKDAAIDRQEFEEAARLRQREKGLWRERLRTEKELKRRPAATVATLEEAVALRRRERPDGTLARWLEDLSVLYERAAPGFEELAEAKLRRRMLDEPDDHPLDPLVTLVTDAFLRSSGRAPSAVARAEHERRVARDPEIIRDYERIISLQQEATRIGLRALDDDATLAGQVDASCRRLVDLLVQSGQSEDVLGVTEAAVAAFRRLHRADPERSAHGLAFARWIGRLLERLPSAADRDGQDRVIALLQERAEALRPMAGAGRRAAALHRTLRLLARRLADQRRRAEATAALVEALELITGLAADDGARYGRRHAATLRELAGSRAAEGELSAALADQNHAMAVLDILRASDGDEAEADLAQALVERAGLHEDSGDATAALRDLRDGVEAFRGLFRKEPGTHGGPFARALTHLAIALWRCGERERPPALLREAVAADRQSPRHRHTSRSRRLNARASAPSVRAEAEIWRVLCASDPEAHRPDLCSALLRLAALEGRPAGPEARELLRAMRVSPSLRRPDTRGGPVSADPADESIDRLRELIQAQQETIDYLVAYIERAENQLHTRIDALELGHPTHPDDPDN